MSEPNLEQEFISNQQKIEELQAVVNSRLDLEGAINAQKQLLGELELRLAPPPRNLGERLLRQVKESPRVDPGGRRFGFDFMKTPSLAELRRNG